MEVIIDGQRYLPAFELGTNIREALIRALSETWWGAPEAFMEEGEDLEGFLQREMGTAKVSCNPEEDYGGTEAVEFVDRVIELLQKGNL